MALNKLTDRQIKNAKSGILGDGGNLYVRVQNNSRSWVFNYMLNGRRRQMGMGSYPEISLANARELAAKYRVMIAQGLDPLEERKKVAPPSFQEIATRYIDANSPNWAPSVAARYRLFVSKHLGALNAMSIADVETPHVVETLKPRWGTPTGLSLRSFIERVFEYGTVLGFRTPGPNPARMKNHIEVLLPQKVAATEHHPSMPYHEVPEYWTRLVRRNTITSKALQFTILMAFRQVETRELRWSEVKGDHIEIEASRYKTRRAFRAPLSPAAKAIIDAMRAFSPDATVNDFVFPGRREHGRPISHRVLPQTMDVTGAGAYTVHGFRSTFGVWATEVAGYPPHLVDMCLGHIVGSKVSRAYLRSDMLEARREIMNAWANYVTSAIG